MSETGWIAIVTATLAMISSIVLAWINLQATVNKVVVKTDELIVKADKAVVKADAAVVKADEASGKTDELVKKTAEIHDATNGHLSAMTGKWEAAEKKSAVFEERIVGMAAVIETLIAQLKPVTGAIPVTPAPPTEVAKLTEIMEGFAEKGMPVIPQPDGAPLPVVAVKAGEVKK